MKSGSLPKRLFFLLILCLLLPRISPATQVIAWGENNYGQTNVPAGLTNAVAIAAGEYISLALRSDGTVIAWGENTITNVPAGLANVIAIAAGEQHCLALKNDGTVIAWGNNSNGQTNVPAGLSNVVAIAAGGNYSVAVKNNGKVIGWGAFALSNPVSGLSNVSAIAIGHFPCIALETNGTVTSLSPVDYGLTNVPPGLSNVQALSAGFTHILALVSNGTCIAWGDDSEGATNVPNNLSNSLVSISAGYGYSLGLTTNNIIASWGNVPIPTSVPAHLTNVIALAAGPYYSLALIDNGAPVIFPQPVAQSIYSGNPVSFLVGGAGVGAISYQWLFNGTNISGATNASLVLTASAASAGNYSVLVSNVYGTSVSSNALLTVTFAAPTITAQPTNQYYYNGSNAVFSVSTSGSQPFIYQWQFDGTNLAGATNSSLVINMQPTNEGYYNVIITNAYGSVTSTPAYINMFDVAAFLNATNLYWSSSSNAPWYYNPRSSLNGMMGVMSGQVTNNSTTLQTFIVGPGAITFFEDLVTSDPNNDLEVFFNGQAVVRYFSGSVFPTNTLYLGEGPQLVQWTYYDYGMLYRFSDEFAFISQFNFVSGTTPAFVLQTQPNLTAVPGQTIFTPHVSGAGTPPLTYQWSQNGTNIAGATNFILNITNVQWSNFGTYTVLITNAYGSASTNFTISLKPPKFNAAGSIATTNGFQLQITNIYAQNSVVISVSSNLINWFPLYTNGPATGAVSFVDLSATNFPQRFYRAAEQ